MCPVSDDQTLTLDGLPFNLRGYNWYVNLFNTPNSLVEKDSSYSDHGDSTFGEDQPWFTDLLHLLIEQSSPTCFIQVCEGIQDALNTTQKQYCF